MTLSITHTTPADGTFSATGATAWDATHSLGGVADISQGGTNATTAAAALTNLGAYPASNPAGYGTGTVTSVTGTAPVVSSGGANPAISMAAATAAVSGYLTNSDWSTFNSKLSAFGSQTANYVYAAPNGSAGSPTFRALVTADVTGLGTIATQNANAVTVTGGSIDGTTVGSTTAAAGSFTTLNSSGNTRLGGASGNQSLQVNNVASAVNYAQVTGAATGAAPTLSVVGSDANIGLVLSSKGTGVVALGGTTTASSGFRVNPVASSVNYVQAQGGITGNPATVSSQGTDSNVILWLQAQGNARTYFVNSGAFQASINPIASAVNYLLLAGGTTGNGAELSSVGSDANINLKLTPKGTGSIACSNAPLSGIKIATFNSQIANATTTGSITIDWTSGQVQAQASPTGPITYTFTAPPGVCHVQLLIAAAATAQTITWPASVIWMGQTYAGANSKAAIINFYYDGTNYYGAAMNQV